MSQIVIKKNVSTSELDGWGSVQNFGEVLEGGDVQAFGKSTYGAPTDPVNAGYFGTTKGKYRLVYPFSEQATIVTGEVRITDESTGQANVYKEGDSWFVTKGTSTVWEVISDSYVKHYFAVV